MLVKQPTVKMHDQGDFLLMTDKHLFPVIVTRPPSHNRSNESELLAGWVRDPLVNSRLSEASGQFV